MPLSSIRIDWDSPTPVYRQIADGIRTLALGGGLPDEHKLPPTRELARRLGVNRNTVVSAYEILTREGWARSHTGRGTFLVPRRPPRTDPGPAGEGDDRWFTAFSRAAVGASSGGLESIYRLAIATEGISFVGSYPAAELMPVEEFSQAMARALAADGASALGYGPTSGHLGLRETIAADMRERGSRVGAEQVLITNGAQQALDLVFHTFLDPGDPVLIEEPTYSGALSSLHTIGARAIGVPVDEEGIRPDLLELALERHRPRLLYVQPTFHNPTTAVMGEQRRREVLALTRRYQCPVVEDDWAGDLRFEGAAEPTLHAMDGGRHVIYLSTFSKKLMPGLRVGWAAAPPGVLERLVDLKRVQDCGTSTLLQLALCNFLQDGGLERHLERVRPAYADRRDRMLEALGQQLPAEARFSRPTGGLFVWVTLPRNFDGNELFTAARRQGVLYSKGELFHPNGSGRNTFRLTYSAASLPQIEEGVAILGSLIRERYTDRPAEEPLGEVLPIL